MYNFLITQYFLLDYKRNFVTVFYVKCIGLISIQIIFIGCILPY